MLIAENEWKEKLNLTRLTRIEIEKHKRKTWYCPSCRSAVQIKNGSIKRPHFAHKQNSNCTAFSENESEEHLSGKALIAENCEKFGINYQLEAYLPKLKQRPDILIGEKLAIEFQCSSLSIDRFKERSLNYQEHDYQVIWLTGQQFHVKKQLSSLQKHFIYLTTKLGFYAWELEVDKKQLNLKYFLIKTPTGLIYKEKNWSLEKSSIWQIHHEVINEMKLEKIFSEGGKNYRQQLNKWNQQLNLKQPHIMKLQEFFYQAGHNLRELSPYMFFPSFLTPLLMEEELLIRYHCHEFFEKNQKGNFQEILAYVKEKIDTEKLAYVLVDERKLLIYCLSFYLCFLKQSGKISQRKTTYLLVMEHKDCPQIKTEILWLPLKYVMIKQ